jgi:NAD(P)-dependent dehydrogenase (short-subunit alcohol dehydrogenase family)
VLAISAPISGGLPPRASTASQHIGKVDDVAAGQLVGVGHGHEALFLGYHGPPVAVRVGQREPDESHVGGAVSEPGRGVLPADLPQAHGCPWVKGGEPGPDRRQQAAASRAGAHSCHQCRLLHALGPLGFGPAAIPRGQGLSRMRQECLPHGRQPYALGTAAEQRGAELPFQHPYLLAERWLGDKKPLGGPGEVQVLGDGHEVAQVPSVHVHNHQLSHQVLDGTPIRRAELLTSGSGQVPKEDVMNRVWLITGASSGFGRAIAEAAVAAGDVAVATARRAGSLDDLVTAHPGQVDVLTLDVTDVTAIDAAVRDVISRHGRIDVLVNNAGRTHVGAVEETTDAEFRELFDVHLFGPVALTRAVLPHMRSRRSGAIVQISSMGGQMSFAGFGAYSATKFALEGMSEALADEVRPLGIKVLIIEPGAFRTGLFGNHSASAPIPDYAGTVGQTRHMVETSAGTQPGDPGKAAAAILTVLDAPNMPLRLPLGDDAVDAILTHLDRTRADVDTWEKLARDTRLAS